MTCHIVGAGVCSVLPGVRANDLLIAADGGFATLLQAGITPDVIIGDFDSLQIPLPSHIETIRLPVEKDDTDLFAAIKEGMRRGFCHFCFYGVTGGRPDHTYANIQLLSYLAEQHVQGVIFDGSWRMSAVSSGTLHLTDAVGTVSVFAVGGMAEGVTLDGLYYPLSDAALSPHVPLGVSNRAISKEVSITVKKGTLLVVWETDRKSYHN